jgi:hypothetical protein
LPWAREKAVDKRELSPRGGELFSGNIIHDSFSVEEGKNGCQNALEKILSKLTMPWKVISLDMDF